MIFDLVTHDWRYDCYLREFFIEELTNGHVWGKYLLAAPIFHLYIIALN